MNNFKKKAERHTNYIVNDIKNVPDFIDWNKNIKAEIDLFDNCQKELNNKLISIEANNKGALAERNQLKALAEEQFNELSKLKQEYGSAEEQYSIYHKEYEKQEKLCSDCEKQKEISPQDKRILFMARKKYYIYKEITNLIWDYKLPFNKMAAGHIRNKSIPYIKLFEFKKSQFTPAEIAEKIWNEIEISSQEKSKDNQENIIHN